MVSTGRSKSQGVIEDITLDFVRYRDPKSNPTCVLSFPKRQMCQFYGTVNFGTDEVCLFFGPMTKLFRRDSKEPGDDLGYLIPDKSCPMWKDR